MNEHGMAYAVIRKFHDIGKNELVDIKGNVCVYTDVCSYQQVDVFLLKSHGNVHPSCERV